MRIEMKPGLLPEVTEISHGVEVLNNLMADLQSAMFFMKHAEDDISRNTVFREYFLLALNNAQKRYRDLYLSPSVLKKEAGTEFTSRTTTGVKVVGG